EFFHINEWQAKLDTKDVSIAKLKKHIENLQGKNIVEKDATPNNAKVIAPGMFKLDLELLSPKLLNNRDAHIDYIKHSREHADTLQEIVEHARALKPLDSDLDSACKYVQRIQEVLVYVTAICPSLTKPSEKLVVITPLNKNKKVRWKPTGQTFIIDGNTCPLTRITSTKIVPLKQTTSKSVITQNPEIQVYSRRPKVTKSIGCPNCSLVYYMEGLGHNLFSVGQFCDSDLEVAFRKHTCYIRDLEGVDLLKGSRGLNLYILSLEDMMLSSPICLLSKASKTKSWLWHQRLLHLNFNDITTLATQGLVRGLPRLKFKKDHLCSACALVKSKKHSHKPKAKDSVQEKLYLLYMDLCKQMRIQSING
ncbi:retrovirus-related pol polyprotein from transposon TNT 1-94, partial [Tanacetum coccineum]